MVHWDCGRTVSDLDVADVESPEMVHSSGPNWCGRMHLCHAEICGGWHLYFCDHPHDCGDFLGEVARTSVVFDDVRCLLFCRQRLGCALHALFARSAASANRAA